MGSNLNKLLTIAIPTYNRAKYLDLCLSKLLPQANESKEYVELFVSNNGSTDNTKNILEKHKTGENNIQVFNHEANRGMDWNLIQCFNLSHSKYLLILGDDDLILDGKLCKIIEFLCNNEVGTLYLNSYWYKTNHEAECPSKFNSAFEIIDDVELYLKKVNYWITFISGNIINKSVLPTDFDSSRFAGTSIPQVYWTLLAGLLGRRNAILNDIVIAAKAENTGGYNVSKVFAVNLNMILSVVLSDKKFTGVIKHINNLLLRKFIPGLILNIRKKQARFNFDQDIYFNDIFSLYNTYINFWFYLLPVIKLPLCLASIWHLFIRFVNKLINYYNRRQYL
jgi:abequosyltransferase